MAWTFEVKRIGHRKDINNIRLNSDVFINSLKKDIVKFCVDEVIPKYESGVSNWQPEHKPVFSYHIYQMMNAFHVAVGTDSGNYDIYRYVDEGTQIRWALMSADWVSKTDPSRYWSQPVEEHE